VSRHLKTIARALKRKLILAYFRVTSPPRVLRFGSSFNREILEHFGAKIGKNDVRIYSPLTIHAAGGSYRNLEIGDGCILTGNNYLDLSGKIILERGVGLAPGVTILTHNNFNYNDFQDRLMSHACGVETVCIKEGTSIKAHVLISHGVTIGANSVVGACAFVNRDIPDNCLAIGIPAKPLRYLDSDSDPTRAPELQDDSNVSA